jgi:mRNA export factor
VATGQSQQVAAHDAPIKCVEYLDVPNAHGGRGMLATGGWDKKLKVGGEPSSLLNRNPS